MLYSLSQRKKSAKQSTDEGGSMEGSANDGDKGDSEGAEKKRVSARRAVVTGARSGKEHKSKRVKKHTSVKPGSSSKFRIV